MDAECRRGRKTIRGLLHPVWNYCHFEELHNSGRNCHLVNFPAVVSMQHAEGTCKYDQIIWEAITEDINVKGKININRLVNASAPRKVGILLLSFPFKLKFALTFIGQIDSCAAWHLIKIWQWNLKGHSPKFYLFRWGKSWLWLDKGYGEEETTQRHTRRSLLCTILSPWNKKELSVTLR